MVFINKGNLAERPPVIETLFENKSVKIDRVTARGQVSPPGDFAPEPSYEFIHLLKGKLVLEYKGKSGKVTLKPGDYSVKTPQQRSRADHTAEDEETVWLKVSYRGDRGKYPFFTGAVGANEVHPGRRKVVSKRRKGSRK